MLFWVILQGFTQITQWKKITPTRYFTVTGRLSISMFLQKISPNWFVLPHYRWPPKVQWKKKIKKSNKKKKVGKAIGDPVGGRDAPITQSYSYYIGTKWPVLGSFFSVNWWLAKLGQGTCGQWVESVPSMPRRDSNSLIWIKLNILLIGNLEKRATSKSVFYIANASHQCLPVHLDLFSLVYRTNRKLTGTNTVMLL